MSQITEQEIETITLRMFETAQKELYAKKIYVLEKYDSSNSFWENLKTSLESVLEEELVP